MLKFEWNLLNYNTSFMELQLTFENPIYVSSDAKGRDILAINITEPNLFISELSQKPVNTTYLTS
jgi:hypothetical protein